MSEDRKITKRQIRKEFTLKRVYDIIVAYKRTNDGLSPSFRYIAGEMGLRSISPIKGYLNILADRNLIVVQDTPMNTLDNKAIKVVGGEWRLKDVSATPGVISITDK